MNETLGFPEQGRRRAVIENVAPEIDAGRFPIKRTVGERVVVEADIFTDGHDVLSAVIKFRPEKSANWIEVSMQLTVNDRWRGEFGVSELGRYYYTIEAWVDGFKTWRQAIRKKLEAGQEISADLQVGAALIERGSGRANALDAERLRGWSKELRAGQSATGSALPRRFLDNELAELMARSADRRYATTYERELAVQVDPEPARFSAWYEMFPRSFALEPGRHGTFRDLSSQLSRVVEMGFDILYFPPIHPIGTTCRKGKNNNPACQPGDPGSPWGIGSTEGGHKAVHPDLGTLEDFRRLVEQARQHGIRVALDIAFQCSPDHPYVKEHPEWFLHRPDGSIQYAENPPKKYQDIYPFDFECDDWKGLWLRSCRS